jgi:hypothetical protein
MLHPISSGRSEQLAADSDPDEDILVTRLTALAYALVMLSTTSRVAIGQARGSFAGVWNNAPEADMMQRVPKDRVGGGGKGVATLTVTQTAAALTISNGNLSSTYRLDGTPTTNYIRVNKQPVAGTFAARWEGARLVVTGTFVINGVTRKQVQTFSLDPSGALVLDTVITGDSQTIRLRSHYVKRSETMT